MYIDLLKNKLFEQETVYKAFKENKCNLICYKGYRHESDGLRDENYINRLRLSYYLLYKKIDDEEVVSYLFQEELKDRESSSFQGIGSTMQVLTQLLRKYNTQSKYDSLFKRAKEANFDCACGYDVNGVIDDKIENNSLLDCIFLAWDLDYKDVMAEMVEEWKENVTDWNTDNYKTLIRFNSFLNKEEENEEIYKRLLLSVGRERVFNVASAYKDIINYYIEIKNYKIAYKYLSQLLREYNLDEIKNIRLYAYFLEYGLEIMINDSSFRNLLWTWIKPELENRKNMFGNLYIKGIAAAKTVDDPFAEKLECEYISWKKRLEIK